jgi:hypothetical protein
MQVDTALKDHYNFLHESGEQKNIFRKANKLYSLSLFFSILTQILISSFTYL